MPAIGQQIDFGGSGFNGSNFGTSFGVAPPGSPQAQGFNVAPSSGSQPGVVPQPGGSGAVQQPGGQTTPTLFNVGNDTFAGSTLNPALTNQLFSFLMSQIGQGVQPFNLSGLPPTTGQPTTPGSLTAPLNPVMQQLLQFMTTGKGGPTGTDALAQMAKTGNPISTLPEFQAMLDAQQRGIQENAANLKEQFAFAGDLVSSPLEGAMTDFFAQTTADQNALLAKMQTGALESAAGRQLTAGNELSTLGAQLGSMFQGLDQGSIDRLLQEFIRTQPQSNPLTNAIFGAGTTFPPLLQPSKGLGVGGALLSNLGGIADIIKVLAQLNKGSGSTGNNADLSTFFTAGQGGGGGGSFGGGGPDPNSPDFGGGGFDANAVGF